LSVYITLVKSSKLIPSQSPAEDASKDAEMLVRQISWLRVYCLELTLLEQPGMPKEAMALRSQAPGFFWLVANLLKTH
jgi:hypothetical protein